MIMVADGCGGWASKGVDPGKYAKALCENVGKLYDQIPTLPLKHILTEADKNNPHKLGSATVVMAKLDPSSLKLKTLILGDSAYLLVRPLQNGDVESLHRSKP